MFSVQQAESDSAGKGDTGFLLVIWVFETGMVYDKVVQSRGGEKMSNVKKMLIVGAILSSAFVLSACNLYKAPSGQTGQQQTTTEAPVAGNAITYSDSGFSPSSVKVKVGEKVEFKNASAGNVQVNSTVHPAHQLYPELNIGVIAGGESKSVTFTAAGTKKYHNHLSPGQTGEIVVE